jgi:hypothetical protein
LTILFPHVPPIRRMHQETLLLLTLLASRCLMPWTRKFHNFLALLFVLDFYFLSC